jgi:hypothetical protein
MTLSQSRRARDLPWESPDQDQAWSSRFNRSLDDYRRIGPLNEAKVRAVAAGLDEWAEMLPQKGFGEHGRPIPANEWGLAPEISVCKSLLAFLTLAGSYGLAERLEGLLDQLQTAAGNLDAALMGSIRMEAAVRRLTRISYEQARMLADLLRMVAKSVWPGGACAPAASEQHTGASAHPALFLRPAMDTASDAGLAGNALCHQESGPDRTELGFSDTEQNILEALGSHSFTGSELARRAGYPFNSNFKHTLSSLRKRGVLGNASPGYFITDDYQHLLRRGQDHGQD